jgi:hypothetical protein
MRLVEHYKVMWEQVTGGAILQIADTFQCDKKKRVIYDNDVGRQYFFSRFLIKATFIASAALGRTDVGFATDLQPEFRIRLDFEVTQGSLGRSLAPGFDSEQFLSISRSEKVFATL